MSFDMNRAQVVSPHLVPPSMYRFLSCDVHFRPKQPDRDGFSSFGTIFGSLSRSSGISSSLLSRKFLVDGPNLLLDIHSL